MVAVALVALIGVVAVVLVQSDRSVSERERDLMLATIEARAGTLARAATALLADQDVAVRAVAGDVDFVHARLGTPLHSIFGYERAFLVDRASGIPLYAAVDGASLGPQERAGLAPAVRRVLRTLGEGGHGFVAQDWGIGLAVVLPPTDRQATVICIAIDTVDDAFLGEIAQRLQVNDLRILPVQRVAETGQARFPLNPTSADDIPLAMVWGPQQPGGNLLLKASPAVALLSLVMVSLAVVFLVRANRSLRALARSEARASVAANRDYLTGLANRGSFISQLEQRLTQARAAGERTALLFIDLNDFKYVNDSLGHAAGDDLLREMAQRLKAASGPLGVCARFGGDEFVAYMPLPDDGRLEEVAGDLLRAALVPVQIDGRDLRIGASVGAAVAPRDADGAHDLMRRADIALYRAKALETDGFCVFDYQMEIETLHRRQIEQELADAIPAGQLALLFQPVVCIESERIAGFEALVRWNHPVHGLLLPESFVPVAERSRLIGRLDAWVLRAACEQARALPEVTLAVNLSAMDLREPDLAARILNTVTETGFDPARLELEITESALFQAEGLGRDTLIRLRDAGVGIALDDFGTGHGSLVHIRSVPVTKIKIDRSFIKNLGIDPDAAAIVEYVARLGRALGIIVTAEGVETREQLRFLRAFGADQAQGFLFAPPLSLEEARARLEERKAAPANPTRRKGGRIGSRPAT